MIQNQKAVYLATGLTTVEGKLEKLHVLAADVISEICWMYWIFQKLNFLSRKGRKAEK